METHKQTCKECRTDYDGTEIYCYEAVTLMLAEEEVS